MRVRIERVPSNHLTLSGKIFLGHVTLMVTNLDHVVARVTLEISIRHPEGVQSEVQALVLLKGDRCRAVSVPYADINAVCVRAGAGIQLERNNEINPLPLTKPLWRCFQVDDHQGCLEFRQRKRCRRLGRGVG